MPKWDGVEATRLLHLKAPDVRVVILTSYTTSDGIAHALEAGAAGALTKTADDNALVSTIRTVAEGGTYVSPRIQKMLRESPPAPEFTERQLDILKSMALGLSNPDIAKQFDISPTVAREHITTILNKLNAANRTEAVAIALRKHLLKI